MSDRKYGSINELINRMADFKLVAKFKPAGDQPKAIKQLVEGLKAGYRFQTLLGVTGSGKTFTMANVIKEYGRPTLVLTHNKTLAAQLAAEYRSFFPENAVEYFVSYYDYYQPEAYVPSKDLYIEKNADINEEIDRMRNAATQALMSRDDVIIVSSVSCIYGLGNPETYNSMVLFLQKGDIVSRKAILDRLIALQYERNDYEIKAGSVRVRGDAVDIFPPNMKSGIRIELWGNEVDSIYEFEPVSMKKIRNLESVKIFAAHHHVAKHEHILEIIPEIEKELEERVAKLKSQGKLVEADRLWRRTRYDLEMLRETGYCTGIENYSRYVDNRKPGEPPYTLLDYFPDDFLMIIDESHMTIPQVRGMYNGDYSRKKTLVEFGFRLPSALDNRPLKFHEFERYMRHVIFTTATPGPYELSVSSQIVEQINRPTGLVDPQVIVKPIKGAIDDLIAEIKEHIRLGDRVLVTTLTKKSAEMLVEYLIEHEIKSRYLHSEIGTIERIEILRDLRLGIFDVLVGVNLLREGLDLPEVSLVAILDADKEGFLRSQWALIQTMGRAARNVHGKVILYADKITDSMKRAIDETNRRRAIQIKFNKEHGITPKTITKGIRDIAQGIETQSIKDIVPELGEAVLDLDLETIIIELEKEMKQAAQDLEFERAAQIRDKIFELRRQLTSGS